MQLFRWLAPLAVVAIAAPPAQAGDFREWDVCGGSYAGYSGFALCASVDVKVTTIGDQHTVEMKFYNLSGVNGSYAGTVFTSIGLDNVMPTTVDVVANSLTIEGPCFGSSVPCDFSDEWQLVDNKSIGGGVRVDLIAGSFESKYSVASQCGLDANKTPGHGLFYVTDCLPGGADVVKLTFRVDEAFDPNHGTLFIKGQNGYNGQSTVCITGGQGQNCDPTTVVPEPITMTLFATGLAAWGGLGAARRRRRNDTEPDPVAG
jgi:hypothetical protein